MEMHLPSVGHLNGSNASHLRPENVILGFIERLLKGMGVTGIHLPEEASTFGKE